MRTDFNSDFRDCSEPRTLHIASLIRTAPPKGGQMSKLVLTRFRVTNFNNIDDSGWIPVEHVTAFVGRNESGKTTLLRALHKLNPALPDPYNAQREFPRDRFTRDFKGNGANWPVCSAEFELAPDFRSELQQALGSNLPNKVICTRFYDGHLTLKFETTVSDDPVAPSDLTQALDQFASVARRLPRADPDEREQQLQTLRGELADWASLTKDKIATIQDLRTPTGVALLKEVRSEANARSNPDTADAVEALQKTIDQLLTRAEIKPLPERLEEAIKPNLPIFIYFENYGILDSAIYLPRFLEDLAREGNKPRVRTINSMFKHVGLTSQEVTDLGREEATDARRANQPVTDEMIARDRERKELRSVKLNSASLDITKRFSEWFGRQRRHNIRYDADGDYFRIWVSDDRRPGVDIELESRSKGFQWFFSFYLVFLVESEEGHKDAILLLDEPGLNLHPTAQQELISFFEELSKSNMLLYTTHSPFLIDATHIHRVRPVTEDATGHSRISVGEWPKDRETIFPLQAAAGYAMVRGLFQHKKNILVEGMSDYFYVHILNLMCRATGRTSLPDDIYITPCGGTKLVGHLASLFLGQQVRPLVLLDGDDAGKARRDALMKELYAGQEPAVLMLPDVLGKSECELEDIFGEAVLLPVLRTMLGADITLNATDRAAPTIVDQIKAAAVRLNIELPDGWKADLARHVAIAWSTADPPQLPEPTLKLGADLFAEIAERFTKFDVAEMNSGKADQDTKKRVARSWIYIKDNGKFPHRLITMKKPDGISLIDGNHRVAAFEMVQSLTDAQFVQMNVERPSRDQEVWVGTHSGGEVPHG
jgi:energy-coupling factor transporter ATP-binding protein EcfA2